MYPFIPAYIPTTVTAFQKFVIVLYMGACIANGSLFELLGRYLMPGKPTQKWYVYFFIKEIKDCDSLANIIAKHTCIRSVILKDPTDLYETINQLHMFPKFVFLMIVKFSHMMAPLVFQISFLLIPVAALVLTMTLTKNIWHFFGCAEILAKARSGIQHITTTTRIKRSSLTNTLFVVAGILIVSFVVCVGTTGSLKDLTNSCQTSTCLYCLPRFMNTVFRQQVAEDPYTSLGKLTKLMFSTTKLVSGALLIILLYVGTIVSSSLVLYILIDAVASMLETVNLMLMYCMNSGDACNSNHARWSFSPTELFKKIRETSISNG